MRHNLGTHAQEHNSAHQNPTIELCDDDTYNPNDISTAVVVVAMPESMGHGSIEQLRCFIKVVGERQKFWACSSALLDLNDGWADPLPFEAGSFWGFVS